MYSTSVSEVYDTIRYAIFTCTQKLTASELKHGTKEETEKITKNNNAVVDSKLHPQLLLYGTLQAANQWQRPACCHR